MLRYLRYRYYKTTKNCVLLFLLTFAASFIVFIKLLSISFQISNNKDESIQNKVPPKKAVINDEERQASQLMHLTEKRKFDDHEYSIIRFSHFRSDHPPTDQNFLKEGRYKYFMPKYRPLKLQSPSWFLSSETFCVGCFVSYGKRVARLKNVLIDPSFAKNKRGGENLKHVLNQSEDSEYLHLERGYFYLSALIFPHYKDKFVANEFRLFLDALTVENIKIISDVVEHKTTIVIVRHEYAYFYHTMADWYGIFLLMVLFHVDKTHLQILWLDAHPKSNLDGTWKTLFGDVKQARKIKEPTLYKDMIWNAIGETNPFNEHKVDFLPFLNEFRHFFMTQHKVLDPYRQNCSCLNIRLILRHKYVAHPRNPNGYMKRKIKNEKEILGALRTAFKQDKVEILVLESMSMTEQVKAISETDLLIGMHGAGLTHIVFLPNTSGVIELVPKYFSPTNKHFHALAKWRRLDYITWRNEDINLEKENHFTVVPEDLLIEMVQEMRTLLCGVSSIDEQTNKPDDQESFAYEND